ncbi:MAG: MBL fold metallo-hydrolase [Brotaphodocola sp.]
MKITYIGHSGFLAELEQSVLLFDYYEGEIPEISNKKKLYVFASHRHGDHFNPEIFRLAEGREQIQFLLSRDIWRSRVPEPLQEKTVQLKPCAWWSDGSLEVRTLRSTDEGVAFLVKAEGKTIYHAGDLNDWRWEGEPEEWNSRMKKHFHKYIEVLRGVRIDAAFIPLDPRQEKHYTLGMDYFLELADAKCVYPMHCWEDYGIIDLWLAEHPDSPYRERIVKIKERGQAFWQD